MSYIVAALLLALLYLDDREIARLFDEWDRRS